MVSLLYRNDEVVPVLLKRVLQFYARTVREVHMKSKYALHGQCGHRNARHIIINNLIKRAMTPYDIHFIREPTRCNWNHGKRPEGLTIIPWKRVELLVKELTCEDTLCKKITRKKAGGDVRRRECVKTTKYSSLGVRFCSVLIAILWRS